MLKRPEFYDSEPPGPPRRPRARLAILWLLALILILLVAVVVLTRYHLRPRGADDAAPSARLATELLLPS